MFMYDYQKQITGRVVGDDESKDGIGEIVFIVAHSQTNIKKNTFRSQVPELHSWHFSLHTAIWLARIQLFPIFIELKNGVYGNFVAKTYFHNKI